MPSLTETRDGHLANGNGAHPVTEKNKDRYQGYHHMTWYVGNAKQAASWYVTRMGFLVTAYKGLETGSRSVSGYVVTNGAASFILISPICSASTMDSRVSSQERELVSEIHAHLEKHGDAVKDVAFEVEDARAVYSAAISRGATGVHGPTTMSDKSGQVVCATIKAFGDTTHTFIEHRNYNGAFLPGYQSVDLEDPINQYLPEIAIDTIDHCVGNQDWDEMLSVTSYYEKVLGFYRFWSVDDRNMCTEFSAMNSIVMSSPGGAIKMPINEPAVGKRTSQVEEFVRFFGGPGVQHVAFRTRDIISVVGNLKKRGVQFIQVPDTYYADLRSRLSKCPVRVEEDLVALQKLSILVDFDEGGYLLQIFTKPLLDRPTVFLEIIQRNNFDGFGAGNFKSLFEAVEREQEKRGTL